MAARKHHVKFEIRIDKNGYKNKYQVVKVSKTPLPPFETVILGTFTKRNLAMGFKTACDNAYNAESEMEYRAKRARLSV